MQPRAELTELSQKLGDLIHNWGFKRIHGRIWTRLFLSNRPLDAADLIEQLDISKALVSISLRELIDVKAVLEAGRSARGTNLYRANGNLQAIYLEVLKMRERAMLEQTAAALSLVAALDAIALNENEISATQVSKLGQFLQTAMHTLTSYVNAEATAAAASVSAPAPESASVSETVPTLVSSRKLEFSTAASL